MDHANRLNGKSVNGKSVSASSDPAHATTTAGCGIAFMAKASAPGRAKTRLVPPLTFEEAAVLNTAFLQDVADNVLLAARDADAMAALPATRPMVRPARRIFSAAPCRAPSA